MWTFFSKFQKKTQNYFQHYLETKTKFTYLDNLQKSFFLKNELRIYGDNEIEFLKKKIKIPNLGDHRICMSAFILSLLTGATAIIKNFETVNTSSPSFLKIMKSLGAKFEKQR